MQVDWANFMDSYQLELLEKTPGLDTSPDLKLDMWAIPLQVNEEGTEGEGLSASAILDGRAGAWSYYPVNHPWENPLLSTASLATTAEDNDLAIAYGGSGFFLQSSLLKSRQAKFQIRLSGDGVGSLGFVPGGDITETSFMHAYLT